MCVNLFYVQITLLIPYEVTRCLKITETVLFKIASEASYVYILIGQKTAKKLPKIKKHSKHSNATF